MKVCVERELPPEVSSLDIHPNWQAIIKQCMQFDPQNRPTAEAVLTLLTQNSGLSGNDVVAKVPVAADAEVPKADSQIDQLARSLAEVKARP